jgi:hypothetical protein
MAIYLQESTARLVRALAERRSGGQQPVLFLGEGVARAAGVPTTEDIARDLYPKIATYLPESNADASVLLDTFYNYWDTLQSFERQSLLQEYFAHVPMPDFFFDLVQLLDDGYFVSVLTTSIDTLLEQALDFSGFKRGEGYFVTNVAQGGKSPLGTLRSSEKTPIRVIKLHGDLSGTRVAITPTEIERYLAPQRMAVKGDLLSGEIALVGYGFESEPINQWLARTPGDLWWVNRDQPGQDQISAIAAAHTINYVDGPNADPAQLFGILRMSLLSQSEPARKAPISKYAKSVESYPAETDFAFESTSPGDTDIEPQFLAQRLELHAKRKRELEARALYVSSVDQDTETQIKYESDQVSKIQQRLDELNR